MSFGGFLGIGERYHPLPWKMLTYDTGLGGYVVDVTREPEGGPTYGRDENTLSTRTTGGLYTHRPALRHRALSGTPRCRSAAAARVLDRHG